MNLKFLNNQVTYKEWLDGLKLSIYFMSPEQLSLFQAVVHAACERKETPEKMQADYDGYKEGSFVQVEGEAENVAYEE